MNLSIRTKFALGIVFFFIIIATLSILSTFQLNMLSKKTSKILKENHYSVVYARDMAEALTIINQEINHSFIINKIPDSGDINNALILFNKSLLSEKNNLTEVGEDKLVSAIEKAYNDYIDSATNFKMMTNSADKINYLQKKFTDIHQQLMLLSRMNEDAIELKTNDAKVSAKKALILMTIIGTFCFMITLSFTYSFASYFNTRFFQLHNGIKEIVSSNYGQRLHFDGRDEFYEIALVFNEMAEKLNENLPIMSMTVKKESEKEIILQDIEELRRIIVRLKNIEEQANGLISKFERPIDL